MLVKIDGIKFYYSGTYGNGLLAMYISEVETVDARPRSKPLKKYLAVYEESEGIVRNTSYNRRSSCSAQQC